MRSARVEASVALAGLAQRRVRDRRNPPIQALAAKLGLVRRRGPNHRIGAGLGRIGQASLDMYRAERVDRVPPRGIPIWKRPRNGWNPASASTRRAVRVGRPSMIQARRRRVAAVAAVAETIAYLAHQRRHAQDREMR